MNERWLPIVLRILIAILLISIVVSGWFVIRLLLQKPATPRTAAERAIMDNEEAVKVDPKSVEARLNLAAAYAGAGRYGDAIRMLKVAIALDPKSTRAYYILGVVYRDQGKTDNAIATLKKASQIEGELGDVYSNIYFELGKAYEEKKDYKNAIAAFLKAQEYDVSLYLLRELAIVYEKVGQLEDAKIAYLNIVQRDTENTEALKALKRLGVSPDIVEEAKRSGTGE